MRRHTAVTFLALAVLAAPLHAQRDSMLTLVHKLAGPRLGLAGSLNDAARVRLHDVNVSSPYIQFGWMTEQRAFTHPGGVAFVFEETWLVGASDQAKLLPSVFATMGVRGPSGWGIGVGPEVSVHGIAIGGTLEYAFQYGGVVLPLTLMVSSIDRQPHASLLVGFAWESIRRH